jgi:hypothetical protein
MANDQWPVVVFHSWCALRAIFLEEATPKEHPKVTNDNRPLIIGHFFKH